MINSPDVLICTRFGIGVTDEGWLRHRVPLIRGVTAPALLAQTDPGFRWAIFTDPDLPPWLMAEVEEMLAPFEGRAFLCTDRPHTGSNVVKLARQLGLDRNGHILTGRVDDDDAMHPENVARIRSASDAWLAENSSGADGAIFTFPRGYEWVMYDMVDVNKLLKGVKITRRAAVRELEYPFMSMSIFALSKVSAGVSMLSVRHPEGELIDSTRPFDFVHLETEEPMWLYCRHKQTDSSTQKSRGAIVDISLEGLCAAFGLDVGRLSEYIASADDHGYITRKKTVGLRTKARIAVNRAQEAVDAEPPDSPERARLEAELAERRRVLADLSEGLVGDLPVAEN